MENVLKHFNVELTEDYVDGLDYYFYEETTADGYSVYVAVDDHIRAISLSEDVYYYDSDLKDLLIQIIEDNIDGPVSERKLFKIYVEDIELEWVEDAMYDLNETIKNI